MELKQIRKRPGHVVKSLLIEPVWNWNFDVWTDSPAMPDAFNRTSMELKRARRNSNQPGRETFNRTSMELKPHRYPIVFYGVCLLIEPVWNWNRIHGSRLCSEPCLLIEPVWNWNFLRKWTAHSTPETFNRTSMELKRHLVRTLRKHAHDF